MACGHHRDMTMGGHACGATYFTANRPEGAFIN